jgi:uncharacterized protein DUF4276
LILPIVEGHAEVEAVPILLRRLLERKGLFSVSIARPFRVKRYQVVRPGEIERAVQQGIRDRASIRCLLLILDGDDDDDTLRVEEELRQRCRRVTPLPVAVVLARRELEAWFLGSKDSLRGICGIRADAKPPDDPESIRGAKERLTRNMEGRRYLEVADQPVLAAHMDLDLALQRCSSFRRLAEELERILLESS